MARRQVVQARSGLWIVLDHTLSDRQDHTATLWTTAHDVLLRNGRFPGSYELTRAADKSVLKALFLVQRRPTSWSTEEVGTPSLVGKWEKPFPTRHRQS